jgi:hypothetical protein
MINNPEFAGIWMDWKGVIAGPSWQSWLAHHLKN